MGDLISRKAAIDKIHEHMEITKQQASGEIRDDDVRLYIALHIAEEFIKTIPSAQPEGKRERTESAIEYCSDCIHGEMCSWYPHEGCEFVEKSEWTAVAERGEQE